MFKFKDEYFSASTNRSLNSIDYKNNLLIFGSSNAILVYNLKTCKVISKLDGHTDKVNCVKFFDSGNRILSCSGDKSAIIWKKNNENNFEQEYVLKENSSSIDLGCSVVLNNGKILTLVFTNDFFINVWLNDELINSKKEKNFVLDLKIIHNSSLFKNQILILLASSDCNVYLRNLNENYNFDQTIKLSGHFDWVRSIDFIFDKDTLMIASGSQDNFIRIWKVGLKTDEDRLQTDLFFCLNNIEYHVILDTVISGHEDKVHCIKWLNKIKADDTLELLSVSLDKTAIIWKQPNENSSNLWFEKNRFGELSSNNLGFLSCVISENNYDLIINSFNGALHYWKFDEQNKKWFRKSIISGHYLPATDVCWDLNDDYLLSISLDTTCRLHVELLDESLNDKIWVELARPQVHGYELNCVSIISSTKFVTGAAEKVLRVYEGTNFFLKSFETLKKTKLVLEPDQKLADFAAVPNLGLSNYAVNETDLKDQKDQNKIVIPETFTEPPKEESLIANTLWPEIEKLYGHNYELFSVAVNHNKKHLASACKSTNVEDGAVFIWDIKNKYKLLEKLHFHKLTVTAIRYSSDYNYLVSVSRDRNWALYKLNEENYELVSSSKNDTILHSRIIWDVAWTPDCKFFLTCSRDKKVFIHSVDQSLLEECILTLDDVPMTIDISKKLTSTDNYFIAFGLENGTLEIFSWSLKTNWIKLSTLKSFHTLSVKKVRFNYNGDKLATCGDDGFLRVISFNLNNDKIQVC